MRQWRTPAARVLLEIPAGTLDVDEATGKIEDPDLAARRELEEETGYRAGTWERLTAFWSAPGSSASDTLLLLVAFLTRNRMKPATSSRTRTAAMTYPIPLSLPRVTPQGNGG